MRILICDDHKIVRDGLKKILQQLDEITLIAEAGDGKEVLQTLKTQPFDLLLLDISLPGMGGLEILELVKEKWPSVKVLILSMFSHDFYAIRALALGASGYITKDSASEELLLAIKKVAAGGKYVDHSIAANISIKNEKKPDRPIHDLLSNREFEIMIKLAGGKSLLEIGNDLSISNKTVSTHRTHIMKKMRLLNNADLTIYCMENNLLF